jgi:hypothetical protein
MKRNLSLLLGLAIACGSCAWLIERNGTTDGNYDTSILGYVSEVAFLRFRGTNVWLEDGHNPPLSYGHVSQTGDSATWKALGGTSWTLSRLKEGLLCVDVKNPTNRFCLKPIRFAPQRAAITKAWTKMREE